MVADEMPGGGDLANERGFGLGAAAKEKESRADVVPGQDFEKAGGPGGVGAIVEGQSEFARAGRSDERRTEELRGWPHGCVCATTCCEAKSGSGAESG